MSNIIDDLELDEVEIIDEEEVELKYPCMVIEGVTIQEELKFLESLNCDKEDAMPLYCIFDGDIYPICYLEYSLEIFQILHNIGDYKLKLCLHSEKELDINLNDPAVYVSLIKI
jgi:hypothetical protein